LISKRAKTEALYAQLLARLWLSVPACNLGNLWRQLSLPEARCCEVESPVGSKPGSNFPFAN
jgi:hypothetical protein